MVSSTRPSPSKHPLRGRRERICCSQGVTTWAGASARIRAEHRRQRPVQPLQPVAPQQRRQGQAQRKRTSTHPQAPPSVATLLGRLELETRLKEHHADQQPHHGSRPLPSWKGR